jgi:L-threonylcarbamoyladenylate synthase
MSRFLAAMALRKIKVHLARGGVIAYATESCFGLGCDPANYRALLRVLRLKRRPKSKGLIVIGSRFEQLARYLSPLSPRERETVNAAWPGPHSWLLPASARCLAALRGRHGKLAVRISAHEDAWRLCERLQAALVSTSANRTGGKPIKTYHECKRQFGSHILTIPGRVGTRRSPSTIQDFASGRILR